MHRRPRRSALRRARITLAGSGLAPGSAWHAGC